MTILRRRPAARGFTLVEILIVITIIAILALIVIPRILGAGRKSKETNLRGQLHELRSALAKFEADCGDNPASLGDLMTRPADASRGGSGVMLDAKAWQGPYLVSADEGLPLDPMTKAADWVYTPETGAVQSASPLNAINGEPYNTW